VLASVDLALGPKPTIRSVGLVGREMTLRWTPPMRFKDDEQGDPTGERWLRDQIDAAAHEARAMNDEIEARDVRLGRYVQGGRDFTRRLLDRFLERLRTEEHLACGHVDEITVWTCWQGPFIAMACQRPACQSALSDHIEQVSWMRHCALCTERSPWLEVVDIIQSIEPGRLRSSCHVSCCPELPAAVTGVHT
jgi:hypothetical protein